MPNGPTAQAAPRTPDASRQLAARVQAFPLGAVSLPTGPFQENQSRNTACLRIVDIDGLLHTFRLNVGPDQYRPAVRRLGGTDRRTARPLHRPPPVRPRAQESRRG
ncbi:hypothetical protein ACWC5O_41355 [Streptomyces sp. NPDC001450]